MNQQQKPSFTSAALQCGGHSNPPVEGDASHSHNLFTTADGDRFVKTGTSFTKRRRLTSRSTESLTSSFHSLLAGPAPCETSEYHQLVLENDNVDVWSSVTPWRPPPPQPPIATPFVSAIQLALAELPEQNRRLAAFKLTLAELQEQARRRHAASIPAPSPSVVQQRTTGIRRGNVSIKYTKEEKRRNRLTKARILKHARAHIRRKHAKVPDEYVCQPKITDAIMEEELEEEMELRVDDSLVVDNGGADNDDDNDLATNDDGDDDDFLTNDGGSDDDDDDTQTATEQDDEDDDDDSASDNTVQLGSMFIHDPRYPTHSAVRRSCRVAARQTTLQHQV